MRTIRNSVKSQNKVTQMKSSFYPKMVGAKSAYWESFKVLYSDLESSFRYVQPCELHLKVYSLRYYELLLRACTEFESICKERIEVLGLSNKKPDKLTIEDYYLLEKQKQKRLSNYQVIYSFDEFMFRHPLKAWKETHILNWYQEYNAVKHNRKSKFKNANLVNVLDSLGALFIMIWISDLCPKSELTFLTIKDKNIKVKSHDTWPIMILDTVSKG